MLGKLRRKEEIQDEIWLLPPPIVSQKSNKERLERRGEALNRKREGMRHHVGKACYSTQVGIRIPSCWRQETKSIKPCCSLITGGGRLIKGSASSTPLETGVGRKWRGEEEL